MQSFLTRTATDMVQIKNGWVYLRPPHAAGSKWDIPRDVMRRKVKTLIGKPIQLEHLGSQKVGRIIDAVCLESDGSTRITYEIDDSDELGKAIVEAIDRGTMRGMSMTHAKLANGDYELMEVSITRSPKRQATFTEVVNEDGVVSCSNFEFDIKPFDNATYMFEAEPTSDTVVAMEVAPVTTPSVEAVTTPVAVATPVATEPAVAAAPTVVAETAQVDAKMSDPSVVSLIEVPLDALGTVFNTEAKQEDRAAAFEMVTDVVSDRARLAAELKRAEEEAKEVAKLREEVARLKEKEKSSLSEAESRKYWAMQVAFAEQNPKESAELKHARTVLDKYINSPELNEKMKTVWPAVMSSASANANAKQKVMETVTQTLAKQVTRNDPSSNAVFQSMLAEKKRTLAQSYLNALDKPATSASSSMIRQPVAVTVEANSMGDVLDAYTQKPKKQPTSKRTVGPFTALMLRHYGEIAQQSVKNLRDLDVVECNNFLHETTRSWLTKNGSHLAPQNMEDAQGIFALGVLVNANARYNAKSCDELVQCSDILGKFLNEEERDSVTQSAFCQASEMAHLRANNFLETPQMKRIGDPVVGGMELATRPF